MGNRVDLHRFIRDLEAAGELHRVTAEVDRELEITEVYDRVVKGNGPALLFENVRGSHVPVLINAFGSRRRMALALGRDPEDVGREAAGLLKPKPPRTLAEAWRFVKQYKRLLKVPPKRVRRGACQEVVHTGEDADLSRIPVLKTWPGDAGPFITLPLVFTKDPETGERNIGMYRMQVFDRNTTGMHWQTHKHGRAHLEKAREMGLDRLEVAVALGGDPALIYSATAPLPPGIDELFLAGFIRGARQRIVKCRTVDLEVPADAEIVLEGHVDVNEPMRTEGPFGDHTGFYSLADDFPAFHVTAVTSRKNPIYPTTVVGVPPQEDAWLGKATERLFLHLLRFQIPEIVDMSMPVEAAFHNLMLVSIKKQYPGHARKAMMSLWGAGMISLEKVLVVYDHDVNVQDPAEAFLRLMEALDPARDALVVDQVPTDTLDHASPLPDLGSHVGIDATRVARNEPPRAPPPAPGPAPALGDLQAVAPGIVDAHAPHGRVLLVGLQKERAGHARAVMEALWSAGLAEDRVLVVFDADVPLRNARMALFHATANLDPRRDVFLSDAASGGVRVDVDATRKVPGENAREWPPVIEMDEGTRALVTKRWSDYGLPGEYRDVETRATVGGI